MQDTQTAAEVSIRIRLAVTNQSLRWLAEQIGVSPFTLSRRMSGTTKFDVEMLDKIADVFNTSLDGLLDTINAVAVNQ